MKARIKKSPNKSCCLDPIPTELLKELMDELAPVIAEIMNLSLQRGKMPDELKHAVVTPRIKKPNLPLESKNYRPVTNLPFTPKLIKQTVINQLDIHFKENKLSEPFQSGYKAIQSTETALVRIMNDMLKAVDNSFRCCRSSNIYISYAKLTMH